MCTTVHDEGKAAQCVLSGLAERTDIDYSLHSSLPSQATMAAAKALYFKKLQHWQRDSELLSYHQQGGVQLPSTKQINISINIYIKKIKMGSLSHTCHTAQEGLSLAPGGK